MMMLRLSAFCLLLTTLLGCSSYLYWPTKHLYINPSEMENPPKEDRVFLNDQESLHVWTFKTTHKKSKGVFIQFHGNAQNLTSHFRFLHWVLNEGYDFVTFDYRGYGQSTALKPTPKSTVEDAKKMLQYLSQKYPGQKKIAVGQSLGGAILLKALTETALSDQPEFIVLDSTFASYKQAARSALKQRWFLYPAIPFTYFAFSDEYAPAKDLDKLGPQPKIILHGTLDPIIRYELGKELYEKLPPKKELWTIEGGYHTAAFTQTFVQEFSKKLINYIEQAPPESAALPKKNQKSQK